MSTTLKFATEAVLQQAIAGLLSRMPGVSGLQILQGPMEYGKDIVFKYRGPFDEPQNCACVIKNTPFSGKSGDSRNLRTIIQQVEQAFSRSFLDERGEAQRVHTVYVVNPNPISVAAMASVEGQIGNRHLVFITGSELYRLFQEHWPGFLMDEASQLAHYERALRVEGGTLGAISAVIEKHQLGNVLASAANIYVPPSFERELRLYRLSPGASSLLGDGAFHRQWTIAELDAVPEKASAIRRLLEHCAEWQFPQLTPQPPIDAIIEAQREVVASLNNGLAQARASQLAQTDSIQKATTRAPGLTLSQSEFDGVARKALAADAMTSKWIQQIDALLVYVNSRVDSFPSDPELLCIHDLFWLACRIDDCLRVGPQELLNIFQTLTVRLPKDIHRKTSASLLIVGGPGSGKTSFCTRSALSDAKDFVTGHGSGRSPLYVALHHLSDAREATFEEVFLADLRRSVVLPQVAGVASEPLRLYLDGFDEIRHSEGQRRLIGIAHAGVEAHKARQIIVTSRDYVQSSSLAWLPRITISGLAEDEIRYLAAEWLEKNAQAAAEFMRQLESIPSLRSLASVPLLAIVTILVYRRTGRIPGDRVRLYQAFVELLCGGWDIAKNVVRDSTFGLTPKQLVLDHLAMELHVDHQREFDPEQLLESAHATMPGQSRDVYERMLAELLADGIITRTGPALHFCHLSFQEYCAAKQLQRVRNRIVCDSLLNDYIGGDDWWFEVLRFFIALEEPPEITTTWASHLSGRDVPDRLRMLFAGPTRSALAATDPSVAPLRARKVSFSSPIRSPMIGSFFSSPAPGAPPFVTIGSVIHKGQIVCLIECMGIRNEIESDLDGTVLDVLAHDAQAVERGDFLFLVDT